MQCAICDINMSSASIHLTTTAGNTMQTMVSVKLTILLIDDVVVPVCTLRLLRTICEFDFVGVRTASLL